MGITCDVETTSVTKAAAVFGVEGWADLVDFHAFHGWFAAVVVAVRVRLRHGEGADGEQADEGGDLVLHFADCASVSSEDCVLK